MVQTFARTLSAQTTWLAESVKVRVHLFDNTALWRIEADGDMSQIASCNEAIEWKNYVAFWNGKRYVVYRVAEGPLKTEIVVHVEKD